MTREQDLRRAMAMRDTLMLVAEDVAEGEVSRMARRESQLVMDRIDCEAAKYMDWCCPDCSPSVRWDEELGWHAFCEGCGRRSARRRTLAELEGEWNAMVGAKRKAEDEEASA